MKKLLTLCIIRRDDQVLLGMKKRRFGVGLWNGYGGKLQPGETLEESLRREVREESGLELNSFYKGGIIEFSFENDPNILEVHIFGCEDFTGELVETEEMRPQWFDVDKIPFGQMWSDDMYWFPFFLAKQPFKGKFHFDKPSSAEYAAKIISQKIEQVGPESLVA